MVLFSKWPVEKVHQLVWGSLGDYGKIGWQRMLKGLAKAPHVAQDVLDEFDWMQCIKRLVATRINVVMMRKVMHMMNNIY